MGDLRGREVCVCDLRGRDATLIPVITTPTPDPPPNHSQVILSSLADMWNHAGTRQAWGLGTEDEARLFAQVCAPGPPPSQEPEHTTRLAPTIVTPNPAFDDPDPAVSAVSAVQCAPWCVFCVLHVPYPCVCVRLCVCVFMFLSVCLCLSACVYLCVCLCGCLCVVLSMCLPVRLSACLCVCVSVL